MKKTLRWGDTSIPVCSFGVKLGLGHSTGPYNISFARPFSNALWSTVPPPVKNTGYTVHSRELPLGPDSGCLREGSRPFHQLLLVSLEQSVFSRRNPECECWSPVLRSTAAILGGGQKQPSKDSGGRMVPGGATDESEQVVFYKQSPRD